MKKLVILTLVLVMVQQLFAVTATPDTVVFEQPNQEKIEVLIKGDERVNWHESLDRYTLLFNEAGYLTYAQQDANGDLVPSEYIATQIADRSETTQAWLRNVPQNLRYSSVQIDMFIQMYNIATNAVLSPTKNVPQVGERKLALALVSFKDKAFATDEAVFDAMLNTIGYQANGTGSVRDFFAESSYNQLDIQFEILGPYITPSNAYYYAGTTGFANVGKLAKWILEQMDEEIDFNDYDFDNDGAIDGFHFVFAGQGKETGGGNGTIWSHKGYMQTLTFDGKTIDWYSCSPELRNSSQVNTIGVLAHELSHGLGAPDFYDADYETGGAFEGTGRWDIMAQGSYNGSPSGNCPSHHNMFQKIDYGWVEEVTLQTPQYISGMKNSTKFPVGYRINTNTNGEYFILENRQAIGFNEYGPGTGLLVLRITANGQPPGHNDLNNTHPQRCYPVVASHTIAKPTGEGAYGDINSANCPFPGTSHQYTSFTDATTPSMEAWDGNNTNKPITDILHFSKAVSFSFMGAEAPAEPTVLTLPPSELEDGNGQFNALVTLGQYAPEDIEKRGYYWKAIDAETWRTKLTSNNNMEAFVYKGFDEGVDYVVKAFVVIGADTTIGNEVYFDASSVVSVEDNELEENKITVSVDKDVLNVYNGMGSVAETMELYDIMGRMVMTNVMNEGDNFFTVPANTGVYIVRVLTNEGRAISRKIYIGN